MAIAVTIATYQFVRYSPEIERADPTFEQALHTAIEDIRRYISHSRESSGGTRAMRDAHAKGYGLARAEVEILDGLPAEYAQGIYGRPGRHEAMVRFSNGSHRTGADALLGNVCGLGLKIFGIDGPTLLEDEPDSHTFDYAMINHPIFFANSVEHYVFIHELVLAMEPPPPEETPEMARERSHQFLHDFLTGRRQLPPEQWAWDELGAFLALAHIKPINLLLSTYWTTGAVRHGDYIAKVRVAPVPAYADQVVWRVFDPANAPDIFRPGLVAELRERPFQFDIQVQLCVDLEHMPIEDLTVAWSENLSPFVTVAKLRLPLQDIDGNDNLEKMDATSMTPWRCTADHRPLGNIQRARKEVYRQSSLLRHELNHQVRDEPKNLAEVFGFPPITHTGQGGVSDLTAG
jgi:hypothetical protein